MNVSPIISHKLKAATTLTAHQLVKITTDGIEACTSSDIPIGTVLQDCDATVPGRDIADVQLIGTGSHYVVMGSGTDIVPGDGLEIDSTAGRVVKLASGLRVGFALTGGLVDGEVIRAILNRPDTIV